MTRKQKPSAPEAEKKTLAPGLYELSEDVFNFMGDGRIKGEWNFQKVFKAGQVFLVEDTSEREARLIHENIADVFEGDSEWTAEKGAKMLEKLLADTHSMVISLQGDRRKEDLYGPVGQVLVPFLELRDHDLATTLKALALECAYPLNILAQLFRSGKITLDDIIEAGKDSIQHGD